MDSIELLPPAIGSLNNSPTKNNVHSQSRSPLFERIPPELRRMIFDLALTEEYSASQAWPQWSPKEDVGKFAWWVRPDYLGRKVVCTGILRTCKRIYFESRGFLGSNKTHIFWHGNNRGPPNLIFDDVHSYFQRFTPAQLSTVKEIRLNLQVASLAKDLHAICSLDVLQGIEKVHLTVRRADWLRWESNARLHLDLPEQEPHQQHLHTSHDELTPPWSETAWGSAFKKLPVMKELLLELEVTHERASELSALAHQARSWEFPIKDGRYLTCHARDMLQWRGPYCNWNSICSICGRWRWARLPCTSTNDSGNVDSCHDNLESMPERLGPELIIARLSFKPGGMVAISKI